MTWELINVRSKKKIGAVRFFGATFGNAGDRNGRTPHDVTAHKAQNQAATPYTMAVRNISIGLSAPLLHVNSKVDSLSLNSDVLIASGNSAIAGITYV